MNEFLMASVVGRVALLVWCNPSAVVTVGWLYKRAAGSPPTAGTGERVLRGDKYVTVERIETDNP